MPIRLIPIGIGGGAPPSGVTATGVSAATQVGSASAKGAGKTLPLGASATASVGAVTATGATSIPSTATPLGVSATAQVGAVSGRGAARVNAPGVQAIASVGTVSAIGGASIPATATLAGVSAVASVGQLIATGDAWFVPGGVQALARVGSVSAFGGAKVSVGGVSAVGFAGPVTALAVFPTIGRPQSDLSKGFWAASSGPNLYAMLNEAMPDDADYISANSLGAVCEMALNPTQYPGTAAQALKFRASSSTGNSLTVRLKCGPDTIKTFVQPLSDVSTEYTVPLSAPEIAAISSGSFSVQLESS